MLRTMPFFRSFVVAMRACQPSYVEGSEWPPGGPGTSAESIGRPTSTSRNRVRHELPDDLHGHRRRVSRRPGSARRGVAGRSPRRIASVGVRRRRHRLRAAPRAGSARRRGPGRPRRRTARPSRSPPRPPRPAPSSSPRRGPRPGAGCRRPGRRCRRRSTAAVTAAPPCLSSSHQHRGALGDPVAADRRRAVLVVVVDRVHRQPGRLHVAASRRRGRASDREHPVHDPRWRRPARSRGRAGPRSPRASKDELVGHRGGLARSRPSSACAGRVGALAAAGCVGGLRRDAAAAGVAEQVGHQQRQQRPPPSPGCRARSPSPSVHVARRRSCPTGSVASAIGRDSDWSTCRRVPELPAQRSGRQRRAMTSSAIR